MKQVLTIAFGTAAVALVGGVEVSGLEAADFHVASVVVSPL